MSASDNKTQPQAAEGKSAADQQQIEGSASDVTVEDIMANLPAASTVAGDPKEPKEPAKADDDESDDADEGDPENEGSDEGDEEGDTGDEGDEASGDDETDDAANEDEHEEDEDPKSKGWPKTAQKRVDKLTRKTKELEAQLDEARTKLEETDAQRAKGVQPSATSADPLSGITDEAALDQLIDNKARIKAWAIENWDGGIVTNEKGEETEIAAEDVRKHYAFADEVLTRHAPARRQWLRNYHQVHEHAVKVYPELFKAGTPAREAFLAAQAQFPEIKNRPNYELVIGDALLGQDWRNTGLTLGEINKLLREASARKKAEGAANGTNGTTNKPKTSNAQPPRPPGISAPRRVPADLRKRSDATERFKSSPHTVADFEASMAERL